MRDSKNVFSFFEWGCRSAMISPKMRSILELPYGSDRKITFALFLSGIGMRKPRKTNNNATDIKDEWMNNDSINARQQAIYEYVSARSFTAINEISKALHIKPSTVRRDIKKLEAQNRVVSFHGGVSVDTGYEKYELRTLKNAEEKKKIGLRAAMLVEPNDAIYIGGGSTNYEFARALSIRDDLKNVFVVVSSVNTASVFLHKSNFKVMIPGGEFTTIHESMTSHTALEFMKNFNFKKAFVATQAVDTHFGYTNPTFELNELKKVIVKHAQKMILLCDHTKIGRADPFITCGIECIHTIITDHNEKTQPMLREMANMGTTIIEV